MAATTLMTLQDVLALDDEARIEVIAGEPIEMAASGGAHVRVAGEFAGELWAYGKRTGVGRMYTAEPGFLFEVDPVTLLVPDVTFIRSDRLPAQGEPIGFFESFAPDLVVEVLSPSNRPNDMERKLATYRRYGVPLIWVADPTTETITAHESDGRIRNFRRGDVLDGGEVLPGFAVPVARFFE